MYRSISLLLGCALLCSNVIAAEPAAETTAQETAQVHFLSPAEIQRTEEIKQEKGPSLHRWRSDKLNAANYPQLMVDPVIYFPKATPTDQASQETLDQIAATLTDKSREILGSKLKIVDTAGPGTLRISTAITGVSIKAEGVKAYEMLPITAVFSLAKAASGNRKEEVHLFLETRIVDAVSGELLGVSMREIEGKDLKGKKDKLEVEDVSPAMTATLNSSLGTLSEAGY